MAAATDAQSKGTVVDMVETAQRIMTKVVLLIDDIAKQTNLLALNVTIELPVRVKLPGKGFAVVE